MAEVPVTRFARNGDVHLAYQVVGSSPIDLLFVDDWVHHVEQVWEVPEFARFLRRLSSFARLIHFDRRGTGLSDPVPMDGLPDLETQVEDAMAVLDAAGSERPVVLGIQVGSLIAMLLAATHPDRCRSLVLYAPAAMALDAPDHPMGLSAAEVEEIIQSLIRNVRAAEIRGWRCSLRAMPEMSVSGGSSQGYSARRSAPGASGTSSASRC